MKKFIGKSKNEEGDDPSRSRLFGKSKSSKTSSPAPPANNPYAQPASGNPYASAPQTNDPYAAGRAPSVAPSYQSSYAPSTASYASTTKPPPSYAPGPVADARTRDEKSPVPPGGYGGMGAPKYGNSSYGSQGGYSGANRYGDEPSASLAAPSRGAGYGGLGRTKSQETMNTQAGRDALFGGAKERADKQKAQETLPPDNDQYGSAGYGGGTSGGDQWNRYQDRNLTAEEEEEEDVAATKEQIKFIKQQDVSSTRNALRIAAQAEETGRSTLERLGQQGERIHNTENNLDLASNQNRIAEEKARELKHLNRSMWAMKVDNPFTKNRRLREHEQAIMDQHHNDREVRQATRREAYQSSQRQNDNSKVLRNGPEAAKKNLAERNKYQFEADSEDEAMEDEIDQNLDLLQGAAGRLGQLGRAMGREVDEQNKHIDRIVNKADKVDDQIVMNRSRLDRIK